MLLPNTVEDKPEFPSATLAIAVDSISRDHVAGAGISSIGFVLLGAAHRRPSGRTDFENSSPIEHRNGTC